MNTIKRIAVLTSGGDAPGMNAAIRAVVRRGLSEGLEVIGIRDGFLGLHQERFINLTHQDVEDIINKGGTILGTARFVAFEEASVREEAVANLKNHNIDALIIIGGNGSFTGAQRLSEIGIPCIGIPATIDNDVKGTDFSIGFDTALNTVVECMDKLRDTCNSHKRVNIVEIMGRHCGDLAAYSGIASGADFIVIPEKDFDKKEIYDQVISSFNQGKRHGLIALAENITNAESLAHDIETNTSIECRTTILGHIQRGGSPSGMDRILASRLGNYAIELLISNVQGVCVGIENNVLVNHPLTIENDDTYLRTKDLSIFTLPSKLA